MYISKYEHNWLTVVAGVVKKPQQNDGESAELMISEHLPFHSC